MSKSILIYKKILEQSKNNNENQIKPEKKREKHPENCKKSGNPKKCKVRRKKYSLNLTIYHLKLNT